MRTPPAPLRSVPLAALVTLTLPSLAWAQYPPGNAPAVAARPAPVVQRDIETRLAWITEVGQRLQQAAHTPGAVATLRLDEVGQQLEQQAQLLRQLQAELLGGMRERREHDGDGGGWGRRRPPPPPVAPGMPPADFQALKERVANEPFERARLDALRDMITAGARFSGQQAVELVDELDFAGGKLQAAVILCGAMAEPGVLPRLIAAMPYDMYKQQLRQATQGRCGP